MGSSNGKPTGSPQIPWQKRENPLQEPDAGTHDIRRTVDAQDLLDGDLLPNGIDVNWSPTAIGSKVVGDPQLHGHGTLQVRTTAGFVVVPRDLQVYIERARNIPVKLH